jgi:hypothetical protein
LPACRRTRRRASAAVPATRSPSRRWVFLLLGGALADLALSFLGLNPLRGSQQLAWFALLGLYALGFAVAVPATQAEGIVLRLAALVERRRRLAALVLVGFGVAGALLAVWALRAFPISPYEYDYIFEAKTFLAGRLWNPLPPLPSLFAHVHLLFLEREMGIGIFAGVAAAGRGGNGPAAAAVARRAALRRGAAVRHPEARAEQPVAEVPLWSGEVGGNGHDEDCRTVAGRDDEDDRQGPLSIDEEQIDQRAGSRLPWRSGADQQPHQNAEIVAGDVDQRARLEGP